MADRTDEELAIHDAFERAQRPERTRADIDCAIRAAAPLMSVYCECFFHDGTKDCREAIGSALRDTLQKIGQLLEQRRYDADRRPTPWIYTIVKNKCIDTYRKEKVREDVCPSVDNGFDVTRIPDPIEEESLTTEEKAVVLASVLEGLTADEQFVLMADISDRELAQILDLSSHKRVSEKRQRLKQRLRKKFGNVEP